MDSKESKKENSKKSKAKHRPNVASEFKSDYEVTSQSENEIRNSLSANQPLGSRIQSFKVRTIWTIIMIVVFIIVLAAGHFYCCLLVLAANICIFNEIISLKRNIQREQKLPLIPYKLSWLFFVVTVAYTSSQLLQDRVTYLTRQYYLLAFWFKYLHLICFSVYIIGFLTFVLSLQKHHYKYQFKQLGWAISALAMCTVETAFIFVNIYDGLFWFIIPCTLVIVNDTFAYIFGFFFGKTPLIKLSPKKTWEGFIGGLFSTLFWSVFITGLLVNYQFLVCPQKYIQFTPFKYDSCEISSIFVPKEYEIPFIQNIVTLAPAQIHAFILSIFAALIAPFGGFFASGFKRAFRIKDFGDSIPGHGGVTDRMDCQIMMVRVLIVGSIHLCLLTLNSLFQYN